MTQNRILSFQDFLISSAAHIMTISILILIPLKSQAEEPLKLSSEIIGGSQSKLIHSDWKYQPGDNASWSGMEVDDDSWEIISSALYLDNLPKTGWSGIGWFRKKILIDSSLINQPIGMQFFQAGAAEIYLDGKRIHSIGKVGLTLQQEVHFYEMNPIIISFNNPGVHLLAIRYSNHQPQKFFKVGLWSGFKIYLQKPNLLIKERVDSVRTNSLYQLIFMMIPMALALLHLYLFIYDRRYRMNLYYVVFLCFFALFSYVSFYHVFMSDLSSYLILYKISPGVLAFTVYFGNITIFAIFNSLKRYHSYLIIGPILITLLGLFFPSKINWYLAYAFISGLSSLGGWILFSRQRPETGGENIIRIGFIFMGLAGIYQMLMAFNFVGPIFGFRAVWLSGVLVFIESMSIVLARDFVVISKNLANRLAEVERLSRLNLEHEQRVREEEVQRRVLEADNFRKTEELEDARRMQLSMLPKPVNRIPGYQVEFRMVTATEVGGDYYDYQINSDDSTIIALGDATGHGMKAGTLVSVIKGLFISETFSQDLSSFLSKCSKSIKKLRLGNMFMGLLLIKLEKGKMTLCSGGMPPVYILRKSGKDIEEVLFKYLPLGAIENFSYPEKVIDLFPGDLIILMSDGYLELFNENDEMLDDHRVKEFILNAAGKKPAQIIDVLLENGEKWRQTVPQRDDITLIAVKAAED